MKERIYYPALFHVAEEGGYWAEFPDLPGCVTEGDTFPDAFDKAREALGLYLTDKDFNVEVKTSPSKFEDLELGGNVCVAMVDFDLDEYKRKHDNRAVKKTLTIPSWLNEQAVSLHINFSHVLQEALILRLRETAS